MRFLTKKSEKHFVGQVIGFDGNKKKQFTKRKKIYHYILFIEDIFPVPQVAGMVVLVKTTLFRHGDLLLNSFKVKAY